MKKLAIPLAETKTIFGFVYGYFLGETKVQRVHFSIVSVIISFLLLLTVIQTVAQDSVTCKYNPSYIEPYKAADETKKWIVPAIAATGYAAITYLCFSKFDDDIQRFSKQNQTHFTSSVANGITDLGLGKVQSIGLAGSAIFAFSFREERLQQTVIIWGGSLLINSTITDQLKKTFQRHRPNTGDPYNSFDWRSGPGENMSFPSAHTSNIFTTATVFATLYKDKKWVPPLAYSLATLVGVSRIHKNVHWTSDVLLGAAIGFLSAKSMITVYKIAGKKFSFLPGMGLDSGSLTVVYNF